MFEKALNIIFADTDDLRKLAEIAGGDPRTFFIGADFTSVDIEPADLEEFQLHKAKFRQTVNTSET